MKKTSKKKKDPKVYPRGWNRKRVEALREYYENQSEEEAVAEAEAAFNDPHQTVMLIPCELVPEVHKLLAAHNQRKPRSAHRKPTPGAGRKSTHSRPHAA